MMTGKAQGAMIKNGSSVTLRVKDKWWLNKQGNNVILSEKRRPFMIGTIEEKTRSNARLTPRDNITLIITESNVPALRRVLRVNDEKYHDRGSLHTERRLIIGNKNDGWRLIPLAVSKKLLLGKEYVLQHAATGLYLKCSKYKCTLTEDDPSVITVESAHTTEDNSTRWLIIIGIGILVVLVIVIIIILLILLFKYGSSRR